MGLGIDKALERRAFVRSSFKNGGINKKMVMRKFGVSPATAQRDVHAVLRDVKHTYCHFKKRHVPLSSKPIERPATIEQGAET